MRGDEPVDDMYYPNRILLNKEDDPYTPGGHSFTICDSTGTILDEEKWCRVEYGMGELHQRCCGCETNDPLDQVILSCDMNPYLRHTEITGEWYIHMGSNQQ